MQRRRRGVGLRRVAGEFERSGHDLVDLRVDRIELFGRGRGEILEDAGAQHADRVALRPFVHLRLGAVGAGDRVALVMADRAIGLGLDQRRALAGTGARGRLGHHLPDGDDVVAVDGDAGNAIGRRAGRDLGVQRRRGERRRRRIEIVLADEDRRRLLDAGEVERFMEAAMVGGAVAEEGDADVVAAPRAGRHAGADGVADAGGDDAVGAEQADRAVIEMHGAAAAAAAAVALAEQLRHQDVGIHALGERVAMAAMGRGDPVGGREMRADADGGRFLANIEMQESGRLALAAGGLRHALEPAQQHHLLVEVEQGRRGQPLGQALARRAAEDRGVDLRRADRRCHHLSAHHPSLSPLLTGRCGLASEHGHRI